MYLKRYTIGSMVYMLFVGWYTSQFLGYTQSESISLFGLHLPALPIAILVLLPVMILFLMTVLHMMYYSIKSFFKLRNYDKDYKKLLESITNALLLKKQTHTYKTDRYKLLGQVIENVVLEPTTNLKKTDDEKINLVLDILHDIKDGKNVDLKKFSLPNDNALVIKNQVNRMRNADLSPEAILNKEDKYSKDILEKAFADYCSHAPMYAIEKHKKYITKDSLFIILARINSAENTLEVSNASLLSLINNLVLTNSDYLSISKELSIHMIPEQRMKLLETLSEQHEEAQEAFLYTLFDLEMIDQAKEYLESVGSDDMLKFRAYLALKMSGYNFSINLFI